MQMENWETKGTDCDWFRNHGWDQRAVIQMSSLESQTDMREHQAPALCSAKAGSGIPKSAGGQPRRHHQAPAVRCTHQGALQN